jgi:hypothetical protein
MSDSGSLNSNERSIGHSDNNRNSSVESATSKKKRRPNVNSMMNRSAPRPAELREKRKKAQAQKLIYTSIESPDIMQVLGLKCDCNGIKSRNCLIPLLYGDTEEIDDWNTLINR